MGKKRRLVVRIKSKNRESKSPQNDFSKAEGDDVMNSARQKFKGVLQDLLPRSDDDSSSDDDSHNWSSAIKKARREVGGSRRSVGAEKTNNSEGFRSSFIMKLFDRTVDLSNYTESTPLYPICRAWIQNSSLYSFTRKIDDIKEESKMNSVEDNMGSSVSDSKNSVASLPLPARQMVGSEKLRVPKPIPYGTSYNSMSQGDEGGPTRDELLADNLVHWTKVRQSWRDASKLNEQRYSQSIQILTNIFNNAQKTF